MKLTRSVFISYSWDSAHHKKWVLQLAQRLGGHGIRVWLDQLSLRPGESMTQFMEQKIRSSGHVLVICTPEYAKRANRRVGGVGYEQQIISTRIAAGIPRHKFIPIIKAGDFGLGASSAMPQHLAGCYAIDMRGKSLSQNKFDELLGAIANVPHSTKRARPKRRSLIRFPTLEHDGWRLESGVLMNRRHPKTFHIPSERRRRSATIGDLVKLIFETVDLDGTRSGERMWVDITGTFDSCLVGKLSNSPLTDNKNLYFGAPIIFRPEHIIDFIPRSEKLRMWRRQRANAKRSVARRIAG